MPIQAQWELTTTTNSFFEVARGVLKAATSDNVQPLAILACEKFGNTVAMSQETIQKIEKLVLPTPKPTTVHFLQGVVGFSANDCATQLGQTSAGVRFLGLAAPLITTLGGFEGAKALELMLRESATDQTLLPTTRQLQDLLQSLEARCHYCGFADSVVGWHNWVWKFPGLNIEDADFLKKFATTVPSPKGLEKVVDSFRQLQRIGPTNVSRIEIRAATCAPWLIAFTKWCTGMPPSIYLLDGMPLAEQPGSMIDLILLGESEADKYSLITTIHHTVGSPIELVERSSTKDWMGMLSISSFGKWLLQRYDLDCGNANRALNQAVPYGVSKVLSKLRFSDFRQFDHNVPLYQWKEADPGMFPPIDEDLLHLRLIPFVSDRAVLKVISLVLGLEQQKSLPKLTDGLLVADLPLVKMHLKSLEIRCSCPKCNKSSPYEVCIKEHFTRRLCRIIAYVLALSLFHFVERLKVEIHGRSLDEDLFPSAVAELLENDRPLNTSVFAILSLALNLVGHHGINVFKRELWAMSSYKGQAVFPAIFEEKIIRKCGFLALSWLPGTLRYHGETYSLVTGEGTNFREWDPITYDDSQPIVTGPCNLLPNLNLVWEITVYEKFLTAKMTVCIPGQNTRFRDAPTRILDHLARTLVVENCSHDKNSLLQARDRFCQYTGPMDPAVLENPNDIPVVGIVAIDGSADLRLVAFLHASPKVLRGKACISCCLDICRRATYTAIVL